MDPGDLIKQAAYEMALQAFRELLEKRAENALSGLNGAAKGLGRFLSSGVSSGVGALNKAFSKNPLPLTGNAGSSKASLSVSMGDKTLAPTIQNPVSTRVA
jgi:hypothetical protein